jgi:transcriptional regulator PpsR
MLRDVAATGTTRSRQVNHPSPSGSDVAITYSAIRLGEHGPLLAVGRDLGVVSAIQHKLIETQQAMERDYWQMRQAETRYRLLFQIATDAVLVVDAGTMRVLDANRAAGTLFGVDPEELVGKAATAQIEAASRPTVEELLTSARITGRSAEVRVELAGRNTEARLSATPFRSEGATLLLVRLRAVETDRQIGEADPAYVDFIERTPDAVVFADAAGDIVGANPAFLDLVQLPNEEAVKGRSMREWFDQPGSDLGVVLALLKKNGVVRLLATSVRGEHGQSTEVELSAVLFEDGQQMIGFVIRGVERRLSASSAGSVQLATAVEQLTGQLGRQSLPDLVQDTTDLVERHYISAALDLSGNNRTTAAELLGLSRQSLYVKLRRYGIDGGKKSGE